MFTEKSLAKWETEWLEPPVDEELGEKEDESNTCEKEGE